MSITKTITKYGAEFPDGLHPLQIELRCIRWGGQWANKSGKICGEGLAQHYLNARKLIWPKRYCHRWTELIYRTVLSNSITILMGCASSQKSGSMSEIALLSYWASPDNTAVLVSSTTRDKLNSAIFAEIKMLWRDGVTRFKWLAGHPLEYKLAILTDNLDADETTVRDERRGIICKPCYRGSSVSGNNYVGLGVFAGIKQENFWFIADELQFMEPTFLGCLPNMRSNTGRGGLRVIGSGNPDHNPDSQLGIVAEPLTGWTSVESNEKTSVWPIKLSGGVCVNLIGTNSPNFDQPDDLYPELIGHEFERILRADYGPDSPEYESQIKGRMKMSLAKCRVITREICRDNKAHDHVIWKGTPLTKIHACDPAYGGGDRCISMRGEFGEDQSGKLVLRVFPPRLVRINLTDPKSPEDQIADSIKAELDEHGILPSNSVYDSFGKGTVGNAFAKVFGHDCPTPINAGERPTKRPVRYDLFVNDEATQERRLKRCDEEYGKFITELWFSVRNLIEAGQMRELPEDVMQEGCRREYMMVSGSKKDVEPKDQMKGRSPDLFDALALLVEIARRKGFRIDRLGNKEIKDKEPEDWLEIESKRFKKFLSSNMLVDV